MKIGNVFFAILISIPCRVLANGTPSITTSEPSFEWGLNIHAPCGKTKQKILAIKEIGTQWIRVDMNWDRIESEQGVFDFECLDRIVEKAQEQNLKIFASLAYTPGWANGKRSHATPPSQLTDWANFVKETSTHFKGKIQHWGIWNEPNYKHFFDGSPEDYVQLLKVAHATIKSVDPDAKVIGPDLAHRESSDPSKDGRAWLRKILEKGGDYIDIISYHIYEKTPSTLITKLTRGGWFQTGIKELLDLYYAEHPDVKVKPFWLTETGWCSNPEEDDECVDVETQARYLVEALQRTQELSWIQKSFIYSFQDAPSNSDEKKAWGLFESNFTPKPAVEALKQMQLIVPIPDSQE